MHRSCFAAALFSLLLAAGCGGSSTSPQSDGAAQADSATGDGAASQQDGGGQQQDGGGQQDSAVQSDSSAPASHTENNNGAMHLPGKNNPLVNCVACHGSDLNGGTGPSCYGCHNNNDHTINRGGKMHLAGTSSSCNACHGPNNTGGLGPSCNGAGCH